MSKVFDFVEDYRARTIEKVKNENEIDRAKQILSENAEEMELNLANIVKLAKEVLRRG